MLEQIRHWFGPPQYPKDALKTRRARMVHTILLIILSVSTIALVGNLLGGRTPFLVLGLDAFVAFSCLFGLYFSRRKRLTMSQQEAVLKALRASEQKYRLLAENMTDVIWTMNPSGQLTYISPSVESLRGYTVDEVLAQTPAEALTPASLQIMQDAGIAVHSRTAHGDTNFASMTYELEQPCKDGTTVWTEAIVKMLFDDEGRFAGFLGVSRNISKRRRTEEALRLSNDHLQAIFDAAGVAIALTDARGAWLQVNQCLLDMVGYTRDELLQLSHYDITHPDDIPAAIEAMHGLLTGQQTAYRLERRYLHKDGHLVWVDLSVTAVRDDQGEVTALLDAGSDITDRKRTEEDLRQSKADLAEAQRIAQLGSWRFDVATQAVSWSDELYRIFGIEKTTFEGQYESFLRQVYPDDQPLVVETNHRAIASGEPFDIEYRIQTPSGSLKHIREFGYATQDKNGQVVNLFGAVQDITASKETEFQREAALEALRFSEEKFRSVIEQAGEAIVLFDETLRSVQINSALERITGVPREDLLGLSIWESSLRFLPPDQHTPEITTRFLALAESPATGHATGFSEPQEYSIRRPDGQIRTVRASSFPIQTTRGMMIGSIIIDVTERRKTEEALRVSEEKFNTIFHASPVAMSLSSVEDDRLLDVNDEFLKVVEFSRDEVIGKTALELQIINTPQQHELILTGLAEHGSLRQLELSIRTRSGQILSMLWSAEQVIIDGVPCLLASAEDITERKRIEESLRETTASLRATFEAIPDLFFRLRTDGTILDYHSGNNEDLYISPELFLGQPIQAIMPPPLGQLVANKVRQANLQSGVQVLEYTLPLPAGDQYFEARFVAITETQVVAVVRNITGRRQTEEQIRRLNIELEQRVIERTMELQTVNAALQEDIHQRQIVEELLRRSEHRYRTLFENAGDAIIIQTLSGQIVEANPTACQIYGYSPREFTKLNIVDLDTPDQYTNAIKRLAQITQTRGLRFETTHWKRDGTMLHVDVNARLIDHGEEIFIFSIVRDITEFRKGEEALRRSEASLAEAQRIAHFGSWTWDMLTNKLLCSDEMFRLVGLHPQAVDITPEVFLNFLPADGVAEIFDRIQRLATHEPLVGLEHKLLRSDGETRTVYSSVKVYRDEVGKPLRLVGSTQDITERKRAEQVVRRFSEEQAALYQIALTLSAELDVQLLLRSIVEQTLGLLKAPDGGIWVYDDQRDLLVLAVGVGLYSEYINSEMYPGEGLSGQAFQQRTVIIQDDHQTWDGSAEGPNHESRLSSVVAAPLLGRRGPLGVLFVAGSQTKQQFVKHDAQLVELLAAQAAIALENAQLLERQQQQYRNLHDTQQRLIQAEKMAALGRLVASISHEINNPLQAVQGCLALVREDMEDKILRPSVARAVRWRQNLDVSLAEVQRIADIVQRLRDFYRPARPDMQPADISVTINSVLLLAAKQLQDNGITVEQTVPVRSFLITTNTDQLKQVILNLILNAIDAMPNGGTLRLVVALDTRPLANRMQSVARIDVVDTGYGISPENLNRLFEPFFTTKEFGSGLGLSISYELIKSMGGEMEAISERGVGSTFTIYLPIGSEHPTDNIA